MCGLVVLWGMFEELQPVRVMGIDAWASKAEPAPHFLATLRQLWSMPPGKVRYIAFSTDAENN